MQAANLTVEKSLTDLRDRWQRARQSALDKSLSAQVSEAMFFSKLSEISDEQFEELLKLVFLNSRNLGKSYQKSLQVVWEASDFVEHLQKLGSPCFQGTWQTKQNSVSLARAGCAGGQAAGSRFCQYWREALDGLVMGISDHERYMRHSSIGSGDHLCVDVIYQDEEISASVIWDNQMRWGPLPEPIQPELQKIKEKFLNMKIDLSFLGISEMNLYYKMESKENLTCGTSGTLFRGMLEKAVQKKFPQYVLKDASPVAVYGEKT